MKPLLTFLTALCAFVCSAQRQLPYAQFLQDTAIQWAAESDNVINLVPKTLDQSLRKHYMEKAKTGLTVYQLNNNFSVTEDKVTTAELKKYWKKEDLSINQVKKNFYDELKPRLSADNLQVSNCLCSDCPVAPEYAFYKIKQLVYYKDGRLHIENVLVTPLCYEKNSEQNGWHSLFSTSFNNSVVENTPVKNLVHMGSARVKYEWAYHPNNPGTEDKILTLQQPALMPLLLRDASSGKFKFYINEEEGKKKVLPPGEFLSYGAMHDTVATYDLNGNQTGLAVHERSLQADSLYMFTITQDFYYDQEHDKLISKISSVDIRKPVFDAGGMYRGTTVHSTMYYNPPAFTPVTAENFQNNSRKTPDLYKSRKGKQPKKKI
jgi:hypothetical protein